MSVGTDTQTTKAFEWMVEKLSVAKANGYWLDRIASMPVLGSVPATARTSVQARSPAPGGGVSRADLDRAIDRAARAEAEVVALSGRVDRLERELEALSVHLEEAVGSYEEGEHKAHWWSRRG